MAILHQNDTGYLICHQKYLEETYRIPYRSIFFDLKTPFLKDLEAESIAEVKETGIEKRRRRKKSAIKKELPIEESHVNNYLTEIGQFFREPPSSNDYRQNNKPAREAVDGFLSMTSPLQNTSLTLEYSNGANDETEKIICNELCIIPPRCQFYRHNISSLDVLVNSNQKFSLIVMDPPWTNRFIKRKRKFGTNSYHSLEDNMLKTMPIGNLCQDSALVAIWCTNSSTHLDYLRNELLPAWKLTYIATWFWIKVNPLCLLPVLFLKKSFYQLNRSPLRGSLSVPGTVLAANFLSNALFLPVTAIQMDSSYLFLMGNWSYPFLVLFTPLNHL